MIKLNFKQLSEQAILPHVNHDTDAGYDIHSVEEVIIQPGKTKAVSTGLALQMEFDFIPFDMKDRIPGTIHQEQMTFVQNFSYYIQEWIIQNFKKMFQIESRSGLASKEGIHTIGGIIDSGYQGEIKIILANTNKKSYTVQVGDKIAQGIPKVLPNVTGVDWITNFNKDTKRGKNGFGSSGK